MPEVYGRPASGLRDYVGALGQVVRVDSFVEQEGAARGARMLRLVNGGGLEAEIHPDRALDLGRVTVDGIPVTWMSSTSITAPWFAEPEGTGWLRTFGGGLLATCGLDTFGPPSEDAGVKLGMHGRIGTLPATVTRAEATAEGCVIEGTVRQTAVFGENLALHRRITSAAGSDTITVEDVVTNDGVEDAPHMIVYHANLGWPLLDEAAVLDIPSSVVYARDADAEAGIDSWRRFDRPTAGFREQVFRHDFPEDSEVLVRLTNDSIGVEFSVAFTSTELPHLYQWKMTSRRHYALGIEPSNTPNIFGRRAARDAGELPFLAPGASARYRLDFRLRRTGADPRRRLPRER